MRISCLGRLREEKITCDLIWEDRIEDLALLCLLFSTHISMLSIEQLRCHCEDVDES